MPNITLSIPEETKRRMEKHPHVKWSSAIRAIIERRLDDFEETERLAQKSEHCNGKTCEGASEWD